MMAMLAWQPFFEPLLFFFDWWFLLAPPMALFIAMVYKAMRVRAFPRYWRQVAIMTIQIILGMIALQIMLVVLVEVIVPAMG